MKFVARHTPTIEAIKVLSNDSFSEMPNWLSELFTKKFIVIEEGIMRINLARVNGYDDRDDIDWQDLKVDEWIVRELDENDNYEEFEISTEVGLFDRYISVGVLEGHAEINPFKVFDKVAKSSPEETVNETNTLNGAKDE